MNLRTLYARGMGEALNMQPSELYDLERELKNDKALEAGRAGAGGGVPATSANVALMLLAILGSHTKRNAGIRAKLLSMGARYVPFGSDPQNTHRRETCPIGGQETIGDTLAVLLAIPKKAQGLDCIEVDHDCGIVTIRLRAEYDGEIHVGSFLFATSSDRPPPPVRTIRVLTGDAFRAIAAAMASGDDE